MFATRKIIIALLLAFCAFAAQAGEGKLTDAQVLGFLASLEELESFGKRHEGELPTTMEDDVAPEDMANLMSSAMRSLEGHRLYGEVNRIVKRHGFRDASHWGAVGDRIFAAYMTLEMGNEETGAKAEALRMIQELDRDGSLPPEQKAQMMAMIESSMAGMEQMMNAPAADVEAVRGHLPALRATMDAMDEE